MATTTLAAIVDNWTTKIEALTPTKIAGTPFRRAPRRELLRDQATANPTSGVLRKFEILRTGSAGEPPHMHPAQVERLEEVTITVAYPVLPALYGRDELDDLDEVMRADAAQIRDRVWSSLLAGQNSPESVVIEPADRSDPNVWFQVITVAASFYEAQSLT